MTEEKIIDGVDVAGCEYYKGKCMEYTHYCQIGCKECTDIGTKLCHYKQTERFKAKIARLEQENKELKIVKEQLKKWNDENLKRQDDMQLWIDLAEEQRKKYRSALEEIKRALLGVRGLSINCDKQIIKVKAIINEVLNPSE